MPENIDVNVNTDVTPSTDVNNVNVNVQNTDTNIDNTNVDNNQSTTQSTDSSNEQPKFKVKYNHEEKELTYDETIQLAQKGMNYDKVQEKLQSFEQHAGLQYLNNEAQKYGMTVDQYLEAVKQQEEQDKINELVQKNIPEDFAKEMLENKKFRELYENEQTQKQQNQKIIDDYNALYAEYPETIGQTETIPQSVWEDVAKGKTLVDAYTKFELTKYKKAQTIDEKNKQNSTSTTGSLTGNGNTNNQTFFTFDQVKSMSPEEVNKNIDVINKSMTKW